MRALALWLALVAPLTAHAISTAPVGGQQVFAVEEETPAGSKTRDGFLTTFKLDGAEHAEAFMRIAEVSVAHTFQDEQQEALV